MTEPIIICPNCKTGIKLTESLAAPLIEAVGPNEETVVTVYRTDKIDKYWSSS